MLNGDGRRTAPYGSWPSPIDAHAVAGWPARVTRARFGSVDHTPGAWFTQYVSESPSTPAASGSRPATGTHSAATPATTSVLALFWAPFSDPDRRVRITPPGVGVGSHIYGLDAGADRADRVSAGDWVVIPQTGRVVWIERATQRLLTLSGDDVAALVRAAGSAGGTGTARTDGDRHPVPTRLTHDDGVRYGDLTVSQGALLAVREDSGSTADHFQAQSTTVRGEADEGQGLIADASTAGPHTSVVQLDPEGEHPPRVLMRAPARFLAWPSLSPDRSLIVCVGWDPPHAPWEETALYAASLSRTAPLGHARQIWRRPETTVLQPEWVSGRSVVVTEDWTGSWRPMLIDAKAAYARASGEPGVPIVDAVPLLPDDALHAALQAKAREDSAQRGVVADDVVAAPLGEDGTGGPLRGLGERWFIPAVGGRRLLAQWQAATSALLWAYPEAHDVRALACDLDWCRLQDLDEASGTALLIGGGGRRVDGLYACHLTTGELTPLALEADLRGHGPWMPTPQVRSCDEIPVVLYPPHSPDREGPDGELPPYVVLAADRPIDQAVPQADPWIAYFTSRGVGVAAVNGAGSAGFGRVHREELRGERGRRDSRDVIAVAHHLGRSGIADPTRMAVSGYGGGGATVLGALAAEGTPFACGTSRHGELTGSPAEPTRSAALLHGDSCRRGAGQVEAVIRALRREGVPYVVKTLPDDGWTAAALQIEFAFYAKIMGFETPHGTVPVPLQGRGRDPTDGNRGDDGREGDRNG